MPNFRETPRQARRVLIVADETQRSLASHLPHVALPMRLVAELPELKVVLLLLAHDLRGALLKPGQPCPLPMVPDRTGLTGAAVYRPVRWCPEVWATAH